MLLEVTGIGNIDFNFDVAESIVTQIEIAENETIDNAEFITPCSVTYHNMTHLETEILGQFCDQTGLHWKEIATVLNVGLQEIRRRGGF